MFNIGDLIIYSGQGICHIDDICKKTYSGITKNYYVLHPVDNCKLNISIPVDNDKVKMLELIERDEAEEILESFREPGIGWVEINNHRNQVYSEIIRNGNRKEISQILNTLMRKKYKADTNGKKLYEQDNKLLVFIQNILFTELAMSLNTTVEEIKEKILGFIATSYVCDEE